MNGWAAELIGQDVADKVGKCLGPRLRHHQGPRAVGGRAAQHVEADAAGGDLWFHGGNLHQSRHYSLYLALQLKARHEGIPTPVYGLQPVHHLS
mgnify:CR=1 FL=1